MYRGAAATTSTTLYTVSSTSAVATVTNIAITNTAAASATATISIDGVVIVPAVTVAANSVNIIDLKQVIPANNPAKVIAGFASATTVNFHISGVEVA